MATQWQAGDIASNSIQLHYTRTGGSKPALVLAHGVTDSGLCWTPVAKALESAYDLIMADARGHGQSQAAESGYDPATQAEDLCGLIKGLNLNKPLIMGHSMGAITTLVLAALHPEVPAAIVLEDPPGWWNLAPNPLFAEGEEQAGARASTIIHGRTDEQEQRMLGMREWFNGLKRKTREQLIAEQHAAAPIWSADELGPWADSKLRVSDYVLSIFDPNRPITLDWQKLLPNVSCPALLIRADAEHGSALSEADATALKKLIPQLEIAHITDAGHNIRREQLEGFMAAVRSFLATVR